MYCACFVCVCLCVSVCVCWFEMRSFLWGCIAVRTLGKWSVLVKTEVRRCVCVCVCVSGECAYKVSLHTLTSTNLPNCEDGVFVVMQGLVSTKKLQRTFFLLSFRTLVEISSTVSFSLPLCHKAQNLGISFMQCLSAQLLKLAPVDNNEK